MLLALCALLSALCALLSVLHSSLPTVSFHKHNTNGPAENLLLLAVSGWSLGVGSGEGTLSPFTHLDDKGGLAV